MIHFFFPLLLVIAMIVGYSRISGPTTCNIAFRAAGTMAYGTGSTLAAPLPSGIETNDIMLCFCWNTAGDAATISASTGTWTQLFQSGDYTVWWSRVVSGSSEPTISSLSSATTAVIAAWSGCRTSGSPIDANGTSFTNGESSGDDLSVAAITTGVNYDKVIFAAYSTYATTATTWSSWAIGSLTTSCRVCRRRQQQPSHLRLGRR